MRVLNEKFFRKDERFEECPDPTSVGGCVFFLKDRILGFHRSPENEKFFVSVNAEKTETIKTIKELNTYLKNYKFK